MSGAPDRTDVLVIGGGPGGQKAAVQAAKEGRRVLLVEREREVGGECVARGTIPSKTLRETAAYLTGLKGRSGGVLDPDLSSDVKVASLMRRLDAVLKSHRDYQGAQMERNGIALVRGRARFASPEVVEVRTFGGDLLRIAADLVVVATGSSPRRPPEIPVDHEHILDSDSILSLIYLPKSLAILGAGVIASEFASIFSALGVEVTMVDGRDRPLGFMDRELTDHLVAAFEERGVRYLSERRIASASWDGISGVVTRFEDGESIRTEKVLCALGRMANIERLDVANAGIELTDRGHIAVDESCRTSVPHIYAVGDVIGPPALAATAMEQGRRAMRHALGLNVAEAPENVPVGIYTIPELASVGLTEVQVVERHGSAVVGRAPFEELARGQICGHTDGLLKLVADPDGRRLLGAQIVGEGATELIHVGQMAIVAGLEVDAFVENIFNFPTMTEGYRIAALDIVGKRARALRKVG